MLARFNSNLYFLHVTGRLRRGQFAIATFSFGRENIKFFNSFKSLSRFYKSLSAFNSAYCFKKSYSDDIYECVEIDSHTYYFTDDSKLVLDS